MRHDQDVADDRPQLRGPTLLRVRQRGQSSACSAQTENTSLTGNFAFRLNDKAEIFADALWSKTIVTTQIQPSPLRTEFPGDRRSVRQSRASTAVCCCCARPNPNYRLAANYLNSMALGELVGQRFGITARVLDFGNRTTRTTPARRAVLSVGVRGEVMEQSLQRRTWRGTRTSWRAGDQTATSRKWAMPRRRRSQQRLEPVVADPVAGLQGRDRHRPIRGPTLGSHVDHLTPSTRRCPATSASCRRARCSTRPATSTVARRCSCRPAPALLSGDIAGLGGATKADRRGPQRQRGVRRTEHPGHQEPGPQPGRRATTATATSARRPTGRATCAGSRRSNCCCAAPTAPASARRR